MALAGVRVGFGGWVEPSPYWTNADPPDAMTAAGWVAVAAALLFAGIAAALAWLLARDREALRRANVARRSAIDAQHRTAELAVAAERIRIVREMHDVLAHSLAIMIAQADGGSYAVADREAAKRALLTIAETGRAALADTRRILGVLRHGEAEAPALSPIPDDASLDVLVNRARDAGLVVSLVRVGRPRPLPAGSRMALYRICQEALTNVLKHAGSAAKVVVTESWQERAVVLTVTNHGGVGDPETDTPDPMGGHGLGLIGMRERADLVGGSLEAGPTEEGFRIRAIVPVGAADPS